MRENSYSRTDASFEVITQAQSGASAPVHFSITTSFGQAEVFDKIPSGDTAIWQSGLEGAPNDHRYYELTHFALRDQFAHYYLVLKDSTGKTRAVQPCFVVKQDILLGMPGFVTKIAESIRSRFSSFMQLPILMVGCSAGEGQLAEEKEASDPLWVVRALGEALPLVSKKLKTQMIVFKDFPKPNRAKLDQLQPFGFRRISSMPATKLELNYKSFDHYL